MGDNLIEQFVYKMAYFAHLNVIIRGMLCAVDYIF